MIKLITALIGALFPLLLWAGSEHIAGKFDYYKLALSYSPEFCIASEKPNQAQCNMNWIVHGLWPQYKHGYPESCDISGSVVDKIDKDAIWRFMPSDYLIEHEWEKHGTCSGLARSEYFKKTQALWDTLTLPSLPAGKYTPQQIRQKVIDSNPTLSADMIELACDDNGRQPKSSNFTLDEIRICFTKQGEFRSCTEQERSCDKLDKVQVRAQAL